MSDAQADLFAELEPTFDDTPAGQLAHITSLLDRDELFMGRDAYPAGHAPTRVYLTICALTSHREQRAVLNALMQPVVALVRAARAHEADPVVAAALARVEVVVPIPRGNAEAEHDEVVTNTAAEITCASAAVSS